MARPRRRISVLPFILLLLAAIVGFAGQQIVIGTKVILLITAEFGQIPVKPLPVVTRAPAHRRILLPSPHGPVVADLYTPRPWLGSLGHHSTPAIILAFGVKVPSSANAQILHLANTFARLGYVTMWPRLQVIARGRNIQEQPSTFVRAFQYLARDELVDPAHISLFGLSVGASTAFVAAAHPAINRRVRTLIFFAGYEDIYPYLLSLATGLDRYHGRLVHWSPDPSAIHQVKGILRNEHAPTILRIFQAHSYARASHLLDTANPAQLRALQRFNPASHLSGFHARIFLLDDSGDHFVPWAESEKLYQALPAGVSKHLFLTTLFQHVLPSGGGKAFSELGQLASLYGFIDQAISSL